MSGKIEAPLGSRANRYAPRLAGLTSTAVTEIEGWFQENPRSYVAVSGGKDSLVCLHLARTVNPAVEGVFFDSGMEFPQTLAYLDRLQDQWGVRIHRFDAEPSAVEVMEASGEWEHGVSKAVKDELHDALILRPLARAREVLGDASIYGLRADESRTRLPLLAKGRGRVTTHDRQGRVVQRYFAPIWRWSYEEVHAYIGGHRLPLNPLYDALLRLGVPERRARVGMLIDGWALDQGRWAIAHALAPDLARQVEARLPRLAEFR